MLPFATTAITITRSVSVDPNAEQDLDSETDYTTPPSQVVTIADTVRAHFDTGSGARTFDATGEHERVTYKFMCDPLTIDDTVLGDDTLTDSYGQTYIVAWARARHSVGIQYIEGECYQIVGAE